MLRLKSSSSLMTALAILSTVSCRDTVTPTGVDGSDRAAADRIDADAWVSAPEMPAFIEYRRESVKGVMSPLGKCTYRREINLSRGESEASRIVSYSPSKCEFIVAVGALQADTTTPASGRQNGEQTYSVESSTEGAASSIASTGNLSTMSMVSYVATTTQYYNDPIHLKVTRQDHRFTWNVDLDQGCVNSGQGTQSYSYLTTSGWFFGSASATPQGAGCSSAKGQALSTFLNAAFCYSVTGGSQPGITTTSFTSIIEGWESGSATFTDYGSKDGPCSVLLSYVVEHTVV